MKLTGQHVHVGTVGDAENVRWDFITSLADVHLDDSVGVDGEAFVRIDGHAEETGVGLLLLFVFFSPMEIEIISKFFFDFFLTKRTRRNKEKPQKLKSQKQIKREGNVCV